MAVRDFTTVENENIRMWDLGSRYRRNRYIFFVCVEAFRRKIYFKDTYVRYRTVRNGLARIVRLM